jgi:hypothetical protein
MGPDQISERNESKETETGGPMLGGRFPLLVILVLGLVVAATKGVPWVLKQFREPTPAFRVDDVRDARYVAPYDVEWPKVGDESPMTVSVHGPAMSAVYSATTTVEERSWEVQARDEVIIARGDDVVALPDGQQISLAAIAFVPTRGSIAPADGDKRVRGLYHPSGRWMEPHEEEALVNRLGSGGNGVFMNPVNTGHAWTLQFLIEIDSRQSKIAGIELRDEITGGRESRINHYISPGWHTYDEFRLESFGWSGVRPNPMALHVLLETKDHYDLAFEPIAPRSFIWRGKPFELIAVYFQEGGNGMPVLVSGDRDDTSDIPTMSSTGTTLVFDSLPPDLEDIRARIRDGSITRARWTDGNVVPIQANIRDIEKIELVVAPRLLQVAIQLPELPGIPPENRELEDVRDMIIPPTVLEDQDQMDRFIASVVQATYYNWERVKAPTTFPKDIGGLTFREVFHDELARYREREIHLEVSPGKNATMTLTSPGMGRFRYSPGLSFVFSIASGIWSVVMLQVVFFTIWKGWTLLRARDLHRLLRVRGYTDWTIWDAERAYLGLGKRAWNIPSVDELGAIPGVDATDVQSVVRFLGSVKENE